MRRWTFGVEWVLAAGLIAACQQPAEPQVQAAAPVPQAPACELSVGWDPWEPYQFEDTGGAMRGLDVEIISLLADDANCDLRFVRGSWQDLLGQVRSGAVDILMAATPTPERQAFAAFSPPYRQERFELFVRVDDAAAMADATLAQLVGDGRRIGITEGYYYGDSATPLILGEQTRAQFVAAPLVELNYTRLIDGEIDAMLDDPVVAAAIMRRKGWDDRIVSSGLIINSGDVALMYSRASVDPAVIERLDRAVEARKADGSLAQLLAKYRG